MSMELIRLAASQGIWAVLSVFLIFYILKVQERRDLKQEERELNYQQVINGLTERLAILNMVKNDLDEIRKCLK